MELCCVVGSRWLLELGAASYAASLGGSDAEIRILGRWSSDAFKCYIRQHPVLPQSVNGYILSGGFANKMLPFGDLSYVYMF